jgi:predicted AlkP superfamily pyrophosphatase or phosphodiesterase
MGEVILVVSDALRVDAARQQMGYLQHLVEVGRATRYTVLAELPTMSRPLYETQHTGVPVSVYGITNDFEEAVQRGPAEVAAGEETSRE